MELDRHAQKARAPFILANGDERATERRAEQRRHRADAEAEDR